MAEALKLPRMSDTMEEGVIANIMMKVGDKIKPGTVIAEVETDKATMELESFQEGVVLYVGAKKGDAIPVNGLLAVLGKEGEDYKAVLDSFNAGASAPAASPAKEEPKAEVVTSNTTPVQNNPISSDNRTKISPLAKKMAEENNIPIQAVSGSGDDGRIVKKDVENAMKNGIASPNKTATYVIPAYTGTESFDEVPVSQMRKTIARRLGESKFSAPHFYLTIEVNMDNAMTAREQMNKVSPVKISFNDMVMKASAMALKKNPAANSSWLGDKIRFNHHVSIGMAVAVEDGLVVPVIRFVDGKSLAPIAAETKAMGDKAKNKQIQPADMQGNTFTISNLGMMGIEEFTAIINPPDACILAVGSIKQIVGVVNGEMKITHVMKMTLSCDHRAVDGAKGAAFLKDLKDMIENPVMMLV
ncbi:MAG: 2-oxo acid dehydrogenase subunit E2 [Bacteroidetes bacterium]|nr:2-oxo acid dehydrogenase subunit E2 [Bacteroidota bacterium]